MKLIVKRGKSEKKGMFGGDKSRFTLSLKLHLSESEKATIDVNNMGKILYEEGGADSSPRIDYFVISTQLVISGITIERERPIDLLVIESNVSQSLEGFASSVEAVFAYDTQGERVYEYDR